MGLNDYSTQELKKIVSESNSYSDVIRKLGYKNTNGRNQWTVQKRIAELNISTSHFKYVPGKQRTDEELFVENSDAKNKVVRDRLKKRGCIEYRCDICGCDSSWNGKPLTLVLDHKNGNNSDNRLENLHWVCPNCNSQLNTTGFHGIKKYNQFGQKLKKDIAIKKSKYNYCIDCGKAISLRATRCKECQDKTKIISPDNLPISRDELKKMIRGTPFTAIGKKFGITDNAIRKWCKKLQLPFKSSVIKKYTDEEWNKI